MKLNAIDAQSGLTRLVIILAFSAFSTPAHADPTPAAAQVPSTAAAPSANAPTPEEVEAFALGYALEYSHQRSFVFLDDVKQLRDINDDQRAGEMVDSLTTQGETVRRLEADALGRASKLMTALRLTPKAVNWADKTVVRLNKSIDPSPKGISSEELVTEHLSAIIDETGSVQTDMIQMLGYTLPDLRDKQGSSVVWAFDAGTYDAKVSLWTGDVADIPMLRSDAQHIVDKEPAATAADLDSALRAVLPPTGPLPSLQKGSGNLSALLPGTTIGPAGVALRALPAVLTTHYQATDLAKELAAIE